MTKTTTGASTPHLHNAAAYLLLMLLLATPPPAVAFYASSSAAAVSVAGGARRTTNNFIIPRRPLSSSTSYSKVITSILWQRQQSHLALSDIDTVSSNSGSYESLGLSDDLIAVTQGMNWDSPTPVQQLAIPAILAMAHRDNNKNDDDDHVDSSRSISNSLWCEGPTGSGKTGSFALPILQLILHQKQKQEQKQKRTKLGQSKNRRRQLGRISTLILCPTRELAAQTGQVLHRLVSHLPNNSNSDSDDDDNNTIISIDVVHGGVPTEMQLIRFNERYNSGVDIDILVATPGRLLDILRPNRRRQQQQQQQQQQNAERMVSSLERRINDALDGKKTIGSGRGKKQQKKNGSRDNHSWTNKGGGRRGGGGGGGGGSITASSLSLNEIREMDLITAAALEELEEDNDDANDEQRDGTTNIREMFRGLQYLVLDEADRTLGKAFLEEMDELLSILPIVSPSNRGNDKIKQLKTMLFSATFPEQIQERVDQVLSRLSGGMGRPLRVSATSYSSGVVLLPHASVSSSSSLSNLITEENAVGSDSDHLVNSSSDDIEDSEQLILGKRRKNTNSKNYITPIQSTMPDSGPNIRHRVIRLNEGDRTQALRFLLEQQGYAGNGSSDNGDNSKAFEWDRVLVFVATRYATEHVARKLRRLGISASELHGKLDQESREQRLQLFRSGKTPVLLATDLAARGIDVTGIDLVVNYDLPKSVADYTHRTGRTGRAGSSGVAISFISGKSEAHFDFLEKRISSDSKIQWQRIEREVLPNFAPDEEVWKMESAVATASVPGAVHSERGLEHDRTFGGIKGRRTSKKDKLREAAAVAASVNVSRT